MSMCIKLYKSSPSGLTTVHVYNPMSSILVVDRGLVGRKLSQKIQKLPKGKATDALVRKTAKEFAPEGYKTIPEERLTTMVVQKRLKGWGSAKNLDARNRLMDLLDEHLGVTGNGHVEGGDIGSGTTNVVVLVADAKVAERTIPAFLRRKKLKGLVVAVAEGRKARVVYPRNAKFFDGPVDE